MDFYKRTFCDRPINKEVRWLGHLLFPALFDGEHKFELIDNGNGTTTFIQSEVLRGMLVPLFKKQLDNNTTNGFNAMNQWLKKLVEKTFFRKIVF